MEPFVELPNTQERWKNLKVGLTNVAEKKIKGLEAFEKFVCENDLWESTSAPFSLLRKVLAHDKHFTEEFFCETLLPWIAGKALQVEELFKNGSRLPVSQTYTLGSEHTRRVALVPHAKQTSYYTQVYGCTLYVLHVRVLGILDYRIYILSYCRICTKEGQKKLLSPASRCAVFLPSVF